MDFVESSEALADADAVISGAAVDSALESSGLTKKTASQKVETEVDKWGVDEVGEQVKNGNSSAAKFFRSLGEATFKASRAVGRSLMGSEFKEFEGDLTDIKDLETERDVLRGKLDKTTNETTRGKIEKNISKIDNELGGKYEKFDELWRKSENYKRLNKKLNKKTGIKDSDSAETKTSKLKLFLIANGLSLTLLGLFEWGREAENKKQSSQCIITTDTGDQFDTACRDKGEFSYFFNNYSNFKSCCNRGESCKNIKGCTPSDNFKGKFESFTSNSGLQTIYDKVQDKEGWKIRYHGGSFLEMVSKLLERNVQLVGALGKGAFDFMEFMMKHWWVIILVIALVIIGPLLISIMSKR